MDNKNQTRPISEEVVNKVYNMDKKELKSFLKCLASINEIPFINIAIPSEENVDMKTRDAEPFTIGGA